MPIGRYHIVRHLASGGMGDIHLAVQRGAGGFERQVVVKTVAHRRSGNRRLVGMLLDEARLAATLHHHNIAQVYEAGLENGQPFVAMEYVHGENLWALIVAAQRLREPIPLEVAIGIVSGVAAGLHHAHERGIVHRDVSPGNIMVGFDGGVKVLDFGIADAERADAGAIKGKPSYMSPEQCLGRPLDRRSDIFSLGICLYELTTLRHAFTGGDDLETMSNVVGRKVVPPSRIVPGYPGALEAIVMTALASDPAARFQTAEAMLEALEGFAAYAKLPVSQLALGRFLSHLFGIEVDTAREPGEDTDVDPLELPLQAPPTYASGELEVIEQRSPAHETASIVVAETRPRRGWWIIAILIALLAGYLCFARSASTRCRSGSPFAGSTIATKLA